VPSASAQVKRAALCLRRLSCAQPGVRWVPTAEAGVSEASGPRVSGCTHAPRYFRPLVPRRVKGGTPHCVNTLMILHAAHTQDNVRWLTPSPDKISYLILSILSFIASVGGASR
jgi:hypothetical protein